MSRGAGGQSSEAWPGRFCNWLFSRFKIQSLLTLSKHMPRIVDQVARDLVQPVLGTIDQPIAIDGTYSLRLQRIEAACNDVVDELACGHHVSVVTVVRAVKLSEHVLQVALSSTLLRSGVAADRKSVV